MFPSVSAFVKNYCYKCYWDGKVYYNSELDTDGTTTEYIICNFKSDDVYGFGFGPTFTWNCFNGSNWHFEQNMDYMTDESYTCYTVVNY